ncbi:uncharacterized protein [Macrobrachium rosenbergii]|uniref:uncharacterized protein n=1 Tax=Macrobrachium rosenbergii TaxID=79674 RepID=UPI0034D459EF
MAGQPAPRIRLSRASTSVSEDDHQTYHDRSEVTATEEELWSAMTPEHLMMLRRHFIQPRGWPGRASLSVSGEDEEETRLLTRPQFIDAITALLDTERFEGACGLIFDAIVATTATSASLVTSSSSGPPGTHISSSSSNMSSSSSSYGYVITIVTAFKIFFCNLSLFSTSASETLLFIYFVFSRGSTSTVGISWGGLITYLANGVGARGRDVSQEKLFTPTPKYILLTHTKREPVAGVTVCGRKKLLIVGARGTITKTMQRVRQQSQQQCGRIHLDSTPDEESKSVATSARKTGLGTWIVEVAMVEEEMAVMAASSSTLHFVETSSAVPAEILRITHLPNLPSCIAAG